MRTNSIRFFIASLVLFCLQVNASDLVDHFAAKYKQARTEVQKRTICVELMDAGVLYDGAPIDNVKKIFQQDFEDMGMDSQSNSVAIVHFVPPEPPSYPMASAIWKGWYLSIGYRSDGTVQRYCLSNEHMETSMDLLYQRHEREGRNNGNGDVGLPVVEIVKPSTNSVTLGSTNRNDVKVKEGNNNRP